jgi:hypothetical protein
MIKLIAGKFSFVVLIIEKGFNVEKICTVTKMSWLVNLKGSFGRRESAEAKETVT